VDCPAAPRVTHLHTKSGKIKAYVIIGRTRFAGLPELPTMGEVGYKKLDLDFWHMLLAPAGTPRPIVERLNAALRHALADERVRKPLDEGGMDVFPPDKQTREAGGALLPAITPALPRVSCAQSWPAKPIRVIIPFSAGSTIDIVARIVFEPLGRQLGQALV